MIKNKLLKLNIFYILICCIIIPTLAIASNSNQPITIKIGAGNKNVIAFTTVEKICEIYNKYKKNNNVSCLALETSGSNYNLEKLISGEIDMGVIAADVQYDAYNGIGKFAGKPQRNLKALFGLYMEKFGILVKKNSGINDFHDLPGKRININSVGSGNRVLVDKLFTKNGWKKSDFKEILEEQPRELPNLFCQNKIDAALYLVGHPNGVFTESIEKCGAKLISLNRKEVEDYVELFRYLFPATIEKHTYKGQNQDIKTIGSQLLLVTTDHLDDAVIYDFVQTVFEHYAALQHSPPFDL